VGIWLREAGQFSVRLSGGSGRESLEGLCYDRSNDLGEQGGMVAYQWREGVNSFCETIHHLKASLSRRGQKGEVMIVYRTFRDTHLFNHGPRGLAKREELRQAALNFIAEQLDEQDIICIAEAGDEYASSVTVWYRE
jgi:hypothetical protein